MFSCKPSTNTKTLPILSKETKEENRKLLISNCCSIAVQLPTDKPWGIIIGDGGFGMLYVVKVKKKSAGQAVGICKGDFLYTLEGSIIDVMETPQTIATKVSDMKNTLQKTLYLEIMRKQTN